MHEFWQHSYSDTIMMNMTSEHTGSHAHAISRAGNEFKIEFNEIPANKIKHVSNIFARCSHFIGFFLAHFLHKSRDYVRYIFFIQNLAIVIVMKINEKSTENIVGDERICYFYRWYFQFKCFGIENHFRCNRKRTKTAEFLYYTWRLNIRVFFQKQTVHPIKFNRLPLAFGYFWLYLYLSVCPLNSLVELLVEITNRFVVKQCKTEGKGASTKWTTYECSVCHHCYNLY